MEYDFEELHVTRDRLHAARILALKLSHYRDTNTIIACVATGGITIGVTLARELNLPLEIISCGVIQDPVHPHQTIASVGLEEVSFSVYDHGLPQDYIWRQIGSIRRQLQSQQEYYGFDEEDRTLGNQNVIVVTDVIETADSITAALLSLKGRNPLKIIVAAPVMTEKSLHILGRLADDIIILNKFSNERVDSWFPKEDDQYSKELLEDFWDEVESISTES